MTVEDQYIQSQITIWGEEYVYDLIDRGYVPTYTTNGWYWVYMPDGADFINRPKVKASEVVDSTDKMADLTPA